MYVQNPILRNNTFKLHAYYDICFAVFSYQNQGKSFFKNLVLELQFYAEHNVKRTPN